MSMGRMSKKKLAAIVAELVQERMKPDYDVKRITALLQVLHDNGLPIDINY